jgi:hypothetical protein
VKSDIEPAGIGGWLLLPALGLAISPILEGVQIFRDILPSLSSGVSRTLSDPTSASYSAMWAPTIVFEATTSLLIFIFTLWLGYLFFFRKSAQVPRLFIAWLVFNLLVKIIDRVLISRLPLAGGTPDFAIVSSLGRSITNAAIWIPYFIRSIRVKNTFTGNRS